MMNKNTAIAAAFTWVGFVGAISFMEAWLKFRAPGVTLPIGLGIGRLVFAALNKMEWILFLSIIASLFPFRNVIQTSKFTLSIGAIMLAMQTIWLLPALDHRAELYITGAEVQPSNLHIYYVITEGIKMISLLLLGRSLFSSRLK